jgi:hypothetical protein
MMSRAILTDVHAEPVRDGIAHPEGFPMQRVLASATVLTVALLGFTACGDDDNDAPTTPVTVEVTFEGDTVTPNGARVKVAVGQPVELDITADAPGEIHVHSDPEQELEYDAGTSTVEIEPIDQPGVVDVESHDLEQVIVQLEVS